MLISCKVSNSILCALEKQGYDLSSFLATIEVPEEFLKDSSYWFEAPKMENFLEEVDRHFTDLPDNYMQEVGRQSEQLRCWGVLDKVLKMVESPMDIYQQPNRFLSYFISPEPPVMAWKQEQGKISFQLPVLQSQYPYTIQYLSGALEGLPAYMGQPWAQVQWDESHIVIQWNQTQANLLPEEDLSLRQFNPQWVRSVMESLEEHQKSVENRQRNEGMVPIKEGLAEIKQLKSLLMQYQGNVQSMHNDILDIKNDFLKLNDYFARAQQLITFLVHSGRKTKQVEEAMRRMDWEHVQRSYASMVELACERILQARDRVEELAKQGRTEDQESKEQKKDDYLQLPIH